MKSNDDNFLKTGDNNLDCINLAGHVTNFLDNEASLDFLSQSNAPHGNTIVSGDCLMGKNSNNNFIAFMEGMDQECKEAFYHN